MPKHDSLVFPSGRSVGNCRNDAKRLSRSENIPLHEAQNKVALLNGSALPWDKAVSELVAKLARPNPSATTPQAGMVKTLDGIPFDDSLNIYTDGSSFPGKKRAAGVGVHLVWMDETGAERTHDYAPTGWQSATIDEMEIEACTVGLTEALHHFPDLSRFRKAFIFTDSMYVKDNFVRAMNIWPQQGWKGARGVRVENVELWKRLRKLVQSFPIRVEVKWVKGHKTSVHNRVADKLAKQSAAMPFNKPLSVSQTASKWSDQKTIRGCVPVQGQQIKIRIVSTEFKSREDYEYRYEVIDPSDTSFKLLDFVRFDQPLSRHKCLLVQLNADRANPRIEQVIEELDPAQMRDAWHKRDV